MFRLRKFPTGRRPKKTGEQRPFHWETRKEEMRYNFSNEEISVINEKFILKLDPKDTTLDKDKLRALLKDSFEEYNREFGSPLV